MAVYGPGCLPQNIMCQILHTSLYCPFGFQKNTVYFRWNHLHIRKNTIETNCNVTINACEMYPFKVDRIIQPS
jgi:hypothetical protein